MTIRSTIFFVSSCFLLMLCMGIPMVSEESDNGCFEFVECPPGEEVKTCRESNAFNCTRCLPGYVQPNYVTSNQHDNTCFKPQSDCVAEDVTYSRTEHKTFCDSLDGCKCNTNKCYYGDPCLCDQHTPGCPVNKSLDENGVCQPCDTGTAKNDTGCGPCRSVSQKLHSLSENVIAMIHKKRPLMPTMETITNSMKEGKSDTTSRSNPICMERTFMTIAIGLPFLELLLVIVIIVLCWRWKKCCFAQGNRRSELSSGANGGETAYMMN
ncbi:uncharacterized protein LOC127719990 isoform X2 [Mytilus californianus]|nr:uncharacterized protein LOC127719990 isoform X2 [Mytilus californianus]XP_052082341.1 uncharacterized protein LOC127719990 isoform X2 [Mytilus californianus]